MNASEFCSSFYALSDTDRVSVVRHVLRDLPGTDYAMLEAMADLKNKDVAVFVADTLAYRIPAAMVLCTSHLP